MVLGPHPRQHFPRKIAKGPLVTGPHFPPSVTHKQRTQSCLYGHLPSSASSLGLSTPPLSSPSSSLLSSPSSSSSSVSSVSSLSLSTSTFGFGATKLVADLLREVVTMLLKSMPSSSFALSFLFLTSLISEDTIIKKLTILD